MASGFCLYGHTATGASSSGPLLIKTGPGVSVAGFAEPDLASKFRDVFGLGTTFRAVPLSDLGTEAAPWPVVGVRSSTVLLFDSAETLQAYSNDREHFPYSEHVV